MNNELTNPFLHCSPDELVMAGNNYTNKHGGDSVDQEAKTWLEEAVMENLGLHVSFWPSFRYGVTRKKVTLTMYPRK